TPRQRRRSERRAARALGLRLPPPAAQRLDPRLPRRRRLRPHEEHRGADQHRPGAVIDQPALVAALALGRPAFAALDVTDPEPLPPGHPLLSLSNVLVAPHVASATVATRARMAEMAVDNLLAALDGKRPPNCVNPELFG